jgi:Uma2 family endonuclease
MPLVWFGHARAHPRDGSRHLSRRHRICGDLERDPDDRNAAVNPTLLVEVSSESTEAYDRGEKAEHYRRIPSLRE